MLNFDDYYKVVNDIKDVEGILPFQLIEIHGGFGVLTAWFGVYNNEYVFNDYYISEFEGFSNEQNSFITNFKEYYEKWNRNELNKDLLELIDEICGDDDSNER